MSTGLPEPAPTIDSNPDRDDAVTRVERAFPTLYLTLISIIQGAVLGFMVARVGSALNERALTTPQWFLVAVSFVGIVAVWNEYMMGSSVFRWIPDLYDSFLPFLLGAAQFAAVLATTTRRPMDVIWWPAAMSAFYLFGILAFANMFNKTDKHDRSRNILAQLKDWPKLTVVMTAMACAAQFLLFFWLLHVGQHGAATRVMCAGSLLIMISFLFFRWRYWRRLVGSPASRRRPEPSARNTPKPPSTLEPEPPSGERGGTPSVRPEVDTPVKAPSDSMALTLSSAFSSICFGVSLAYLGEKVLTTYHHDWLALILAAMGFVKLVDSWWWYFYVLEKVKPTTSLYEWYSDFLFCLSLFLLMGLASNPAAWFCAFAACNFIGCLRIDLVTRTVQAERLIRACYAGQLMWKFGPWAVAVASIASVLTRLLLPANPWELTPKLDIAAAAFIVGTLHLMVTCRAWKIVRGRELAVPRTTARLSATPPYFGP
jgi:hypothetical protein